MSNLKPIPIAVLKEKAGSKGLITSIERFLNGAQTPRALRLKGIARLLIEKKYLTISELETPDKNTESNALGHKLSRFLFSFTDRKSNDNTNLIGEYYLHEKLKSRKTKISQINIIDSKCECCMKINKTITFVLSKKTRRFNVSHVNYHLEGWISRICGSNSLIFLTRSFDNKTYSYHMKLTDEAAIELRDNRDVHCQPNVLRK